MRRAASGVVASGQSRVRRRAPPPEQVFCGWRLARRHCAVQRRAAVGGARADQRRVGAEEDAERIWTAVRRREADRVHAVVAPHERRAGASVEQDLEYARVAALGMNEAELSANPRADEHCVHDLNTNPELPFESGSFDRALIVVSIQYLTRPVEVLAEAARALRDDGAICIAMSHRLFPTKAIAAFHRLQPAQRVRLVSTYLSRAGFGSVRFVDRSPDNADPLWLVLGEKSTQDTAS